MFTAILKNFQVIAQFVCTPHKDVRHRLRRTDEAACSHSLCPVHCVAPLLYTAPSVRSTSRGRFGNHVMHSLTIPHNTPNSGADGGPNPRWFQNIKFFYNFLGLFDSLGPDFESIAIRIYRCMFALTLTKTLMNLTLVVYNLIFVVYNLILVMYNLTLVVYDLTIVVYNLQQ